MASLAEEMNGYTNCWIAPDGAVTGCRYHEHEHVAYEVFGTGEHALERRGYVKVSGGFPMTGRRMGRGIEPTRSQLRRLERMDLTDSGEDILNEWLMER